MALPYLAGAYVVPELVGDARAFPLTLPFVPTLDLRLDDRVTIFVGDNGTGKSTAASTPTASSSSSPPTRR